MTEVAITTDLPEFPMTRPTLFRRIPTLRMAVPVEELPLKHGALAYAIYELPVTW